MRVAVGIPVCGPPSWGLLRSLLALGPIDLLTAGTPDRPLPIPVACQRIAEQFLAGEWDVLLHLDSDALLAPGTLVRLASWGRPVVGALYFSRHQPIMPNYCQQLADGRFYVPIGETRAWLREHAALCNSPAALLTEPPVESLAPAYLTGFHCLLVRREAFADLEPPYYRPYEQNDPVGLKCDRYFCESLQAAGHTVHVDRSVVAGHIVGGEAAIGAFDFMAYDSITDWATHSWRI